MTPGLQSGKAVVHEGLKSMSLNVMGTASVSVDVWLKPRVAGTVSPTVELGITVLIENNSSAWEGGAK